MWEEKEMKNYEFLTHMRILPRAYSMSKAYSSRSGAEIEFGLSCNFFFPFSMQERFAYFSGMEF